VIAIDWFATPSSRPGSIAEPVTLPPEVPDIDLSRGSGSFAESYDVDETTEGLLGRGAFSRVCRCEQRAVGVVGKMSAVKIITKTKLTEGQRKVS